MAQDQPGSRIKDNLRAAIGRINFMANQDANGRDLRAVVLGSIKLARKTGALAARARELAEFAATEAAVIDEWREPAEIEKGGDFDVCDLRIWLALAERADVPFIEARPILSVSENMLDALLPALPMPKRFSDKLDVALSSARADLMAMEAAPSAEDPLAPAQTAFSSDGNTAFDAPPAQEDIAHAKARMEEALFDVPASWMVRTHLGGASSLKALVGTGLMEKGDDVARIAEGVSIGAGWFQLDNHRLIDFSDRRFLEVSQGHKPVTHYLARPWCKPARFHEGEDLHRANSPLAGPGKWPAEWRVFVRNGQVTGVANYYGWTGQGATPENCWNAIEAAALGQAIADTAQELGLVGRSMRMEHLRAREADRLDVRAAFAGIDPNGLHCTLDFLEGEDGLVLLEGGPAHIIGAGGHPCAFAGQGVDPTDPARLFARCEGVAVLPMPHVHLAEQGSWVDGAAQGCILDWEEANTLAHQFRELSEAAEVFLAERASAPERVPCF